MSDPRDLKIRELKDELVEMHGQRRKFEAEIESLRAENEALRDTMLRRGKSKLAATLRELPEVKKAFDDVERLTAEVSRFRLLDNFGRDTLEFAVEWLEDDIDGANGHDPSVGINRDDDLADVFRSLQDYIREHLPLPETASGRHDPGEKDTLYPNDLCPDCGLLLDDGYCHECAAVDGRESS